ncbi:hypothetical protein J4731_24835 [Providencia rettgeri]|nr:hypothetical protein [Providencia rettgeri]
MRDLLKVVLSLVLAMASGQALADLPIVLVDEARLPMTTPHPTTTFLQATTTTP